MITIPYVYNSLPSRNQPWRSQRPTKTHKDSYTRGFKCSTTNEGKLQITWIPTTELIKLWKSPLIFRQWKYVQMFNVRENVSNLSENRSQNRMYTMISILCLLLVYRIIRNIYINVISGLILGSENTIDHFIVMLAAFFIFSLISMYYYH